MATESDIPTGQLQLSDMWGDYNQQTFVIRQMLGRLQTATLVRVDAVTNSGGVSPVGFVDVTPMVNQVDNNGIPEPHVSIFDVPYFRLQGGTDAIILDPKVGDIGIAVFASRDISKVKNTKATANPGSNRKYDFGDALYIGGVLNGAPTQYIRFSTEGIVVHSPTKIICEAPEVQVQCTTSEVNASDSVSVTAATSAVVTSGLSSVTAPTINLGAAGQDLNGLVNALFQDIFNNHTHALSAFGDTSAPDIELDASCLTTTLFGG